LKDIIGVAEQKRNSYQVEVKMASDNGNDSDKLDQMKRKERKTGFL
jgi:hypothetical protein